jgi:hypothetical protein
MKQYQTAYAVVVHAVGAAALGICLWVLVPKWFHNTWGMEVPKPLVFVAGASNILRNFGFVAVPIALWLDTRIYSGLLRRKGEFAGMLWADGVTVFLFAALLFVVWAMSTPLR